MTTSSEASRGYVDPTELPIVNTLMSPGWREALSFCVFGTGTAEAGHIADFEHLWFPHVASATIVGCIPTRARDHRWRIQLYRPMPEITVDVIPVVGLEGQNKSISSRVLQLHRDSGLTWQQIAKLFGVSRRAVHGWAAGARINARNEERLTEILYIVNTLEGDADLRRRALLAPSEKGPSMYDRIRVSGGPRGNASHDAISPIERLGAADDERRST